MKKVHGLEIKGGKEKNRRMQPAYPGSPRKWPLYNGDVCDVDDDYDDDEKGDYSKRRQQQW